MKAVLAFKDDVVYVTFERRINDPFKVLNQIAQDFPPLQENMDKLTVKFTPVIPKDCDYVLYHSNGNEIRIDETDSYEEAAKFVKPKESEKRYPTLKILLEKYAK